MRPIIITVIALCSVFLSCNTQKKLDSMVSEHYFLVSGQNNINVKTLNSYSSKYETTVTLASRSENLYYITLNSTPSEAEKFQQNMLEEVGILSVEKLLNKPATPKNLEPAVKATTTPIKQQ